MGSLYSRLAGQWNVLFPPDADRVSFLVGLLDKITPAARIIEVGCGTGTTAISLATLGFHVAASDLDPVMIAIAKETDKRAAASDDVGYYPALGQVRFFVDDMIGSLENAPADSTHAVLCLGNTLPHLTRPGELDRFFRAAGKTLVADGVLIIQILNYPRIIRKGGLTLPELKGDGLLFRRRQVYNEDTGLISFHTEVESSTETEARTHKLFPIDRELLSKHADAAGLSESGAYCDWKYSAFEGDSPWIAAVYTRDEKN
jgi:glycine/sarcosine N-methyltransferase